MAAAPAIASRVLGPRPLAPATAAETRPNARQRERAATRLVLVRWVLEREQQGVRRTVACRELAVLLEQSAAPEALTAAARSLRGISRLADWCARYRAQGFDGLLDGYKGRARREYGWEVRALNLWATYNQPAYATVALWLREEGCASATNSRVRRFLKSQPDIRGRLTKRRVGAHHYNQNLGPHAIRDATVLPVGFVYEADGHTVDVYVQHPETGKAYRPELTVWVDVRSHYVVGWWLSASESAATTLFSLSHALVAHDHVPAAVHTDPGPGFANKLVMDEISGYAARLGIEVMLALPGNAKGKGLIEGGFKHYEERLGKRYPSFCGHCRSDQEFRRLQEYCERGKTAMPTLAQYSDGVADYFERLNAREQRGLGCAPAALWAQLERVPVEIPAEVLVRPVEQRVVRRWRVELYKRFFQAPELAAWNGRKVAIEYNLHDFSAVTVRDLDGRLICEAKQVEQRPWLAASRIEELAQKRLANQIKRKQQWIDEQTARARLAVDARGGADREMPFLDGDDGEPLPLATAQKIGADPSRDEPAPFPNPASTAATVLDLDDPDDADF